MFIRKKRSPHNKDKYSVQIVESVRKGDRVSQTILRHVGTAMGEEELKAMMDIAICIKINLEEDRQPFLPLFDPEDLLEKKSKIIDNEPILLDLKQVREEQRFNEGIFDVFGSLYDELGFNKIFEGRFEKINNSILKSCVLARTANPSSKLRTSELLEDDFAIKLPVDKIYRMMTQLEGRAEQLHSIVKASTLNLLNQKVKVLLYDVTTLYFESFTKDDLRNNGFSKDCKFKETQIVMALITTQKGLPITYKIFPGNTQETKTLIPTIEDLKNEYDVAEIDFAADRGMFSDGNLKNLENNNIKYVVSAKLRTMDNVTKEKILKIKINHNNQFKVSNIKHKGRRLVVCYSPKRACKDKKDRDRLVERVEKLADKKGNIEVKKLINNNGTKKYLKFAGKQKKVATINIEKIVSDSEWDGVYGYITNSTESDEVVISRYNNLWEIEESFRINKHDLKIRPIFHRDSSKIKAHLDICFLTYALARQLSYRFEIQQGERISFRVARNELLKVQSSVLVNKTNNEKYILPSKISALARKLYRVLGLKKSITPYRILKK